MSGKLSEEQVKDFDVEYITPKAWEVLSREVDQFFPNNKFKVLDVGGGNGVFADTMLEKYPSAEVVLVDNSEYLLERNQPKDGKRLVECSAEEIPTKLRGESFDLISFNWVLHHLVHPSYARTTRRLNDILTDLKSALSPNGRISVFENMYDGLMLDNLPSHLIYHLSSSKLLAPLTQKMGANTAGVGVCFRSRKEWFRQFRRAGFSIDSYWEEDWTYNYSIAKKLLLHLGDVRVGHIMLSPA